MNIHLIRHGKTKGNLLRVYLGSTDEQLCQEGKDEIINLANDNYYPLVDKIYCSPLKRAVETAKLIYKSRDIITMSNLAERGFGIFEYKSYEELKDNLDYINWLNTMGVSTVEGMEDYNSYTKRVIDGFNEIVAQSQDSERVAIISHGGSIMEILRYLNGGSIYDYQLGNSRVYSFAVNKEEYLKKR